MQKCSDKGMANGLFEYSVPGINLLLSPRESTIMVSTIANRRALNARGINNAEITAAMISDATARISARMFF